MNDLRQFIPRALVFLAVFAVVGNCCGANDDCKAGQPNPWWSTIRCNGKVKTTLGPFGSKDKAAQAGKEHCDNNASTCEPCSHSEWQGLPLNSQRRARFTAVATCGAYEESATAATAAAARRQATRKLRRTLRACGVKAVCECHCITVAISQSLTLALPQCPPQVR